VARPWTAHLGGRLWSRGCDLEDGGDVAGADLALRRAARLGEPMAQDHLAVMLDGKLGRPRDAVRWHERAFRSGYDLAAWNLAMLYRGRRNRILHMRWLRIAARSGDIESLAEPEGLAFWSKPIRLSGRRKGGLRR
jgi:TPR repeat protein